MNEPEFKIVFLGETGTGKSSIVNILTRRKILNYYEATIGMSFQKMHLLLNEQMTKLQIVDTSGAERDVYFSIGYCKDAQLICIVIDASKSDAHQIETIKKYKKKLAEQDIPSTIRILVIANKEDIPQKVLGNADFPRTGIDGTPYVRVSAMKSSPAVLIEKFAAMLKDVVPFRHKPAPAPANRTCSFISMFSCSWLSTLFNRLPPRECPQARITRRAIASLTRDQVSAILISIHQHLKNGALGNKAKPYELGWFGGTRSGCFMNKNTHTASFNLREVFFESKAKYPEHVMGWLSMTAPCAATNLLSDEERLALDLHLILRNLYNDIVKFTDVIPSSYTRRGETATYYSELPGFIEGEINKMLQSSNNHLPILGRSPELLRMPRAS